MKHLFVPYELALKLKEKGFNEECFAKWVIELEPQHKVLIFKEHKDYETFKGIKNDNNILAAPLYQQVIEWFIKTHNILIEITLDLGYEYESGKFSDNIYLINLYNMKNPTDSKCPNFQRQSGEQLEYIPTINKAIKEALKIIS